jgi:hypothetical protein
LASIFVTARSARKSLLEILADELVHHQSEIAADRPRAHVAVESPGDLRPARTGPERHARVGGTSLPEVELPDDELGRLDLDDLLAPLPNGLGITRPGLLRTDSEVGAGERDRHVRIERRPWRPLRELPEAVDQREHGGLGRVDRDLTLDVNLARQQHADADENHHQERDREQQLFQDGHGHPP